MIFPEVINVLHHVKMTIGNISGALIAKEIYTCHIMSGLPKGEPYNSMCTMFANSNFVASEKKAIFIFIQ